MCDTCADVLTLFLKYENDTKFGELRCLQKQEVNTISTYVHAWSQRQCTCCYKESQNFDRFNSTLQGLILTVLKICSSLCEEDKQNDTFKKSKLTNDEKVEACDTELNVDKVDEKLDNFQVYDDDDNEQPNEEWSNEEKDRLLLFSSKIFLLNFPLYLAFKHSVNCKLEEVTQDELSSLGSYCDVNDLEIPIHLLRNVCFLCQRNGLKIFKNCFDKVGAGKTLPLVLAHGITAIVANIKLWMSLGAAVQHLVPLRSSIVKYLCRVPESDLRIAANRNMFEYMWTIVKDPIDPQSSLDREGLDLAFKYFSSSTLTMRLAGIAQINNHINIYSDLSHNENLVDAVDAGVAYSGPHSSLANLTSSPGVSTATSTHLMSLGNALANWLIDNRLVEYIFGPNLHVEIIKQSQIILNYLAYEGRLTNSHIEVIWSAAQLKHCSRQVLDLLPPLIKNLDVGPVLYLYRLLQAMEVKDHNEQTLLLSSALIKFLWSNTGNSTVGQHAIQSSMVHVSHLGPTENLALGLENLPSTNPYAMINKEAFNRVRISKEDHDHDDDEDDEEDDEEDYGSCSSSPACGAAIISRRIEGGTEVVRMNRADSSSVESSSQSSSTGGSSTSNSSGVGRGGVRLRRKRKKRKDKQCSHRSKIIPAPLEESSAPQESDSHLHTSTADTSAEKISITKDDEKVLETNANTICVLTKSEEIPSKSNRKRRRQSSIYLKANQTGDNILSPEKLMVVPQVWASSADDEGEDEDEDRDSESSNHEQYSPKTLIKNKEQIIISGSANIQNDTRFINASSDESVPEAILRESQRDGTISFHRHHRHSRYRGRSSKRARLARFKGNKISKNGKLLDGSESKEGDADMEHLPHLVKAILESTKEEMAMVGSELGTARFKDVSPECLTHLHQSHSGMEASSDLCDVGEDDEDEDEDEEEDEEEDDCENSSQMSNKSEKNMADFEGELESGCDDELAQLAAAAAANLDSGTHRIHPHLHHRRKVNHSSGGSSSGNENPNTSSHRSSSALNSSAQGLDGHHFHHGQVPPPALVTCLYSSSSPNSVGRAQSRLSSLNAMGSKSSKNKLAANQPDTRVFQIDSICEPGQTLLWDLVQDDKISQLGEGLAPEAEKILCNLVCWSNVRMIRMKFIEGCLKNLANNRSVLVSLRLLPRLFASFQQFRGSSDCHSVTMWAEKEHHMMKHFFGNVVAYVSSRNDGTPLQPFYNHTEEIQVRLHFLSRIFSTSGSPETFKLSREQINALWCCLATDPECSDELFSWLLNQARSNDQHALSLELFKHIFLEKMPQLPPESTSMTALALLQQLGSLARLVTGSVTYDVSSMDADVGGIRQLWGIALKAHSTDVSMAAIQNLNQYYINVHHGTLEKEDEFIQQCMDSLKQASNHNLEAEESYLTVIQRALLLLKTHIDTFQKRYAYHLRRWHLANEGVTSHRSRLVSEKTPTWIRIICQPAGTSEKKTFELQNNDYVADLRAEVTNWFEKRRMNRAIQQSGIDDANSSAKTLYSGSAPEGPIRMISQGQELTSDLDEKTLSEMGFKDMQLVFVSIGMARPSRCRRGNSLSGDMGLEPTSSLPPPPRSRLPILLLLQSEHFEQLFTLMQQLGALKAVNRSGQPIVHTKAQILSRRVWEILMMLPTSPDLLKGLEELGQKDHEVETTKTPVKMEISEENEQSATSPTALPQPTSKTHAGNLMELLNPESPQKLMYALQIIEAWRYPRISSSTTADNLVIEEEDEDWSQKFVEHGGLRHLFDIFMSGVLQAREGVEELWNEWHQDCLASLLKLLYLFGIKGNNQDSSNRGPNSSHPSSQDEILDISTASDLPLSNRTKRNKRLRRGSVDKLLVPKLNKTMLSMMDDVESVLKVLMSILYKASVPTDPNQYRTGFWGRGQVVHCAITLLVSWAFCDIRVKDHLFRYPNLDGWLKRLVLDDPEPAVRREVCTGLYRLCLGSTVDGDTGHGFIGPLLGTLMKFLSVAQNMRPPRPEEEEKEPYGPGCKDYFWLVCRLIDSLDPEDENQCFSTPDNSNPHNSSDTLNVEREGLLDLDNLARYLAKAIVSRDYRETRHNTVEDDGLRGLLSLATVVVKRDPAFKFSKEGRDFLLEVFDCLFALPSPKQRYLPKCKSGTVRSAAFDLIVELIKGCYENYQCLLKKLMEQHSPGSHGTPYPWDYWPHEDGRSECGYVGLTNLGATCYLASCMQHLYMMPPARNAVLSAQISTDSKHEKTLRELQRMFAYLLESERKAYNPRSFCRVYTMDHQPLNTGEQKDMAEFFTDLISKLEEMTPQLKSLVKNLFCGMISNNVVSLDCPHISRTLEEFYTLRCQVADMRNLFESLDELTVKDTLEGDNMYTCSQCGKKVRAEKRACINKLPRILCFNTMRYTFNMATMTKEKVNTHFSFPPRLDMAPYLEANLLPESHHPKDQQKNYQSETETNQNEGSKSSSSKSSEKGQNVDKNQDAMEYELIGVTVHTGTADGGHYYSFIRERHVHPGVDKWLLFNDAEVKPFDPQHIAAECFGGEMTSKTYDSVTDKFLDFSFEKTNSAYMLFYERVTSRPDTDSMVSGEASGIYTANHMSDDCLFDQHPNTCTNSCMQTQSADTPSFELSPELAEWIWQDNMQFLQDRNLFEHTYFDFMWQVCGYVPQTLPKDSGADEVTLLSAKLGTSFVLETLIHSKEKPTIAQWIELLTKQFNASQAACEWFLDTMSSNDWWLVQILLKCPNQVVRQLFQRLCIHVINQLRPVHAKINFQRKNNPEFSQTENPEVGSDIEPENSNTVDYHSSCIGRFLAKMIDLVELGYKQHLTEYFAFLLEFSKMGEEESRFLLSIQAVSTIVNFYLGQKANDFVEVTSDDEDEEDECSPVGLGMGTGAGNSLGVLPLGMHQHNGGATVMGPPNSSGNEKYKPASLEKMISLVSILVENSRGERDQRLQLSPLDLAAVASPKNFPFLQQQIKDNINLRQTCYLIISLCRWNDHLAHMIVNMMFNSITKQPEQSAPFFKALSMLVDLSSNNGAMIGSNVGMNACGTANPSNLVGITSGISPFANLILQRIWETAEYCPQQCLEWLTLQAPRNKTVHTFLLHQGNMEAWVERFLIAHSIQRVRYVAALVLVSLVPSNHFRQAFRSARSLLMPQKDAPHMSNEATMIMHQIFETLLRLLKRAKLYVDATVHGTTKLMSYFALMTYCLVSKTEKLMLGPFFMDLWSLFQPKLSEPAIPVHHNKQALLIFWYQACVDCPENVKLIVQNPHITKNIAFNYILADHDDQEVIVFNRCMLPAYYGLLRLCCQQSQAFTRQLASHQNIQWAFKNITPYTTQYTAAISELFKLMRLFVAKYPEITTDHDLREIHHFKCNTMQLYLTVLDARQCWATLVNALRILMETTDDRLFAIVHGALVSLCQAFHSLHLMYHEATACHVTGDMVELLSVALDLLKCARACRGSVEVNQWLNGWKDRSETVHKLLTLLNGYTPPEVRQVCIEVLQEIAIIYPENTLALVVPLLANCHAVFQDNNAQVPTGPFFPTQGQSMKMASKSSLRPQRPMLQMFLHPTQVQPPKGVDKAYDQALLEFFLPYHQFVDTLCRLAVSHNLITPEIVNLSAMLAMEGVPLHLNIFPKLWLDIYHTQVDHEFLEILWGTLNGSSNNPNTYLSDYVESVLMDEKTSLNDPVIYQLFSVLLPKVSNQGIIEQAMQLAITLVTSMATSFDHEYIQSLIQIRVGVSQVEIGIGGPQQRRSAKHSIDDLELQTRKLIGDLQALTLIFGVEKPPTLPQQFKKVILAMIDLGQAVTNSAANVVESTAKEKPQETAPSNDVLTSSDKTNPQPDKCGSPDKEETPTETNEEKSSFEIYSTDSNTRVWPKPGEDTDSIPLTEASSSKESWAEWKQECAKASGMKIIELEDGAPSDSGTPKISVVSTSAASGSLNTGAPECCVETNSEAFHWAQMLAKSANALWSVIGSISCSDDSPTQ